MDWLINLGYVGLFIGAAMAGSFLPVSSDIFLIAMLLAGGNPITCLLVGTVGYWLGGLTCYGIGWIGKWEWLKRFHVSEETLEKQKVRIDKYGMWLALFPWLPVAGRLASLTMGFYKIKPKTVATLMLIGCFFRFLVWTLILYFVFADKIMEWTNG